LFQALLGAIVIKVHLEAVSVVVHLAAAMALLGLVAFLALGASVVEERLVPTPDEALNRSAWVAAGFVLGLMLVGSYVSGTGAGRAFTDWPLMGGRLIPSLAVQAQAVQFLHRLLAVAAAGAV